MNWGHSPRSGAISPRPKPTPPKRTTTLLQDYENHRLGKQDNAVQPLSPSKATPRLARVKSLNSPQKEEAGALDEQMINEITFQNISRDQAEEKLRPYQIGTYLLRTGGRKKKRTYALSLRTSSPKGFDHYRIETNADTYFIEPEFTFPDLKSLILRYQEEKQPVLAAEILYPLLTPENVQRSFSSALFSSDDFTLSEKIGQGEYGHVYSSICADPQRLHHRYSALKEIKLPLRHSKTGKIVPVRLREFSEIRLLPHLHSDKSAFHNIIQHYGIQYKPGEYIRIVIELMPGGSLLDALKTVGKSRIKTPDLLGYARQICSAMIYLKHFRILHRDIAARNVLLDETLANAKLGDFGLAVTISELEARSSTAEIETVLKKRVPVKWTAPECLEKGLYSFSSEMWSFGITLWEMWSYGRVPYRKIYVEDVLEQIQRGVRCELPVSTDPSCLLPVHVHDLLQRNSLWSIDPSVRPTIDTVEKIFKRYDAPA